MANYTWDHLHVRTADPEGTVRWFEENLGATVTRSTVDGKPRFDMKVGGANVFYRHSGNPATPSTRRRSRPIKAWTISDSRCRTSTPSPPI